MTTTLDVVSPKKPKNDDRSAEAAAAAELVRLAKEQGLALTGPDGLLSESDSMQPCLSANVRNRVRREAAIQRE